MRSPLTLLIAFFSFTHYLSYAERAEILIGAEKHEATYLHERYLKAYNLPKELYPDEGGFLVSLGYIENIEPSDIPRLKKILKEAIEQELRGRDGAIKFYFGSVKLKGDPKFPKVVSLARNHDIFEIFNQRIARAIDRFRNGRYTLSEESKPENYLPAMELNGMIGVNLQGDKIDDLLEVLSFELRRAEINLNNVVFRWWRE